jgi:hypothetical protein
MIQIPAITDLSADAAVEAPFDLGIWAKGFEERSSWLITSSFRPARVFEWYRVEFLEHRDAHSALRVVDACPCNLLGGAPAGASDDGHWVLVWRKLLGECYQRHGRPLRIFVDYSSMPRTVYGTLLVECMRSCRELVDSVTMAYVPGDHGPDIEGSRVVRGLRGLVGTEGASNRDGPAAFILGLGYDGALAEAVVDLFQVSHYSCFYADPGVLATSVDRVLAANADLVDSSDIVEIAPAHSIAAAMNVVMKLKRWYADQRDVLVVPLGPKPHVVGALLAAALDSSIGFRFPSGPIVVPVQVTVKTGTVPFVARISFAAPPSSLGG